MSVAKKFKHGKFRSAKELARSKPTKSPYETIFIVCEDSKSAPAYFNEMRKQLRLNTANVRVVPGRGAAPISVVDHGIDLAKSTAGIDCIACVFDRDAHESFNRAKHKLAEQRSKRGNKSNPRFLAITSNPCFEFWILLHFIFSTKAYVAKDKKSAADIVLSELCGHFPAYKKEGADWFLGVNDKRDNAIKNAQRLEKYNQETGSDNPSTNIHELVIYLRGLAN